MVLLLTKSYSYIRCWFQKCGSFRRHTMLSALMNTNMPWAPSAWKHWVDHIIRQGHKFGLKRATLVHANGTTAAATSGFMLPSHEIQVTTYCLKVRLPDIAMRTLGLNLYWQLCSCRMSVGVEFQFRNVGCRLLQFKCTKVQCQILNIEWKVLDIQCQRQKVNLQLSCLECPLLSV